MSPRGLDKCMSVRALFALLLLNAGPGTILAAQSGSREFVEVTIGYNGVNWNVLNKAERYEEGSPFALLAFGRQPDASRSLLAAFHVGLLTVAGGDAACSPTPLGGCGRDNPLGSIIAITVGARPLTSLWRALELSAGPAVIGRNEGGITFGLLAVGRIGLPPGTYLSPGLAVHGILTPIDGTVLFAGGLGLSLRTW
jgi:hypothetical protein